MNRLAREKSPYLLQHAANPVDWFPWGQEAFAEARARDVPVFLSVGYAACHWCHVMERESFESEEVARLLNARFVPVKVDREELPAVDHLAMAYTQAMTGGGGWPTTVLMTPSGRPFFAGTYFPRESAVGRPGMLELLPKIAALWGERRPEVVATADRLLASLRERLQPLAGPPPGAEAFDRCRDELGRLYDPRFGGFGDAPKFPTPTWLLFLTRHAAGTGDPRARAMVEETLRAMRLGGIWDHLGGGFHRYATDRGWLVPHFEKMLYDQALLALAYAEAFAAWGEGGFRRTAGEILAYVLRDLRAPEGGFAAAEDADSEGEEGRFYVWGADEVAAELGPEAADEFLTAFHARPNGNYRAETGEWSFRNILHRLSPLALSAADFALPAEGLPASLEASREKLLAARSRRPRPLRDDKVLADWNGLAVAALARCAAVFEEPRYAQEAGAALDFALGRLRDPAGDLVHRYRDGEASCPAVLDDYACLAWGALELHAAGDAARIETARALAAAMLERFGDGAGGALFFAPPDPLLPLRQVVAADAAAPSGNAVAVDVLLRLGRLTGEARWEAAARGILAGLGGEIERSPLGCAHLLTAAAPPGPPPA